MTTANLYTVRNKMESFEKQTPSMVQNMTAELQQTLNPYGRKHLPGHRSEVTPSVLARRFPEVLAGGLGLPFQLRAYRRIAAIRAKTRGPWRAATLDLLGDLAQHLDPLLSRERAERTAKEAIPESLPLLQAWLEGESA